MASHLLYRKLGDMGAAVFCEYKGNWKRPKDCRVVGKMEVFSGFWVGENGDYLLKGAMLIGKAPFGLHGNGKLLFYSLLESGSLFAVP